MTTATAEPWGSDPIAVLSLASVNPTAITIENTVPYHSRLFYICHRFIKSVYYSVTFLIMLALPGFAIYQIVLACYNCPLPSTNLGWIRACLFLNIPFVLIQFIRIAVGLFQREFSSYVDFLWTSWVYLCVPGWHFFVDCYVITGIEMNEIRKVLQNATALASLPCPESYYRQVFGVMIAQCISPVFFLFFLCFGICFGKTLPTLLAQNIQRCDQLICRIKRRWRQLIICVCRYHPEETVVNP